MPNPPRFPFALAILMLLVPALATAEQPPTVPGAHSLVGEADTYAPLTFPLFEDVTLQVPSSLAQRFETLGGFPVDRDATAQSGGLLFSPRVRAGVRFDTGKLLAPINIMAEYEHDVFTAAFSTEPAIAGQALPNDEQLDHQLRKASARIALGPYLQLSGGVMTSHWGLGLLANDGAHGWQPGSAQFGDPRGGDRVVRGMISTGPHTQWNAAAAVAVDSVWDDDALLTAQEQGRDDGRGDGASQFVAAVQVGVGEPQGAGIYVVRRRQWTEDGRFLEVTVLDWTGRLEFDLGPAGSLKLEGEAAFITGKTDYIYSPEIPVQNVQQIALAGRAKWEWDNLGVVLDALYASGDPNPNDGRQSAFRADPNYEMGLFLFRHLLAAHSGRAPFVASNLDLVGEPAIGLERVPTRGAATNTIAVFPRFWYRPFDGLEAYGGPLLAFAEAPLSDPFNSRVAGGAARNALDGEGGTFLGTEIDVGLRYRALFWGTELTAGLEAGLLIPGDAFDNAGGESLEPIFGGRFTIDYRI